MALVPATDKKAHWLQVLFRDRVLLPGSEGVIVPSGQTFERPAPAYDGTIRYNTQLKAFEGYVDGVWLQFPVGSVAGEANTASNLGTGIGVFANKVGVDLRYKSLLAGANVNIIDGANEITISATSAGETNTMSNVGGFAGVFQTKVGVDFQMRTLQSNVPGTLSITETPATVLFDLIGAPYLSLSGGAMSGDISFGAGARVLADTAALATTPAIAFAGDTDTGFYSHAPDQIGIAANGTTIFFTRTNGVLAAATINYETFVVNDQDIPNKKYVDDVIAAIPDHVEVSGDTMTGSLSMTGAAQFLGNSAGSASVPSYAFDTLAGTGFFPTGGNSIGITTTGAHRWTITGGPSGGDIIPATPNQHDIGSTGFPVNNVFSNRLHSGAGSAALPSHTFTADPTVGLYYSAGGIGFSTGGLARWVIGPSGNLIPSSPGAYDIGTTGSRVNNVHAIKVNPELGTAALPAFYMGLDTNTGIWGPAADTIGFATAGLDRMQIQDNGLIHAETASYETLVVAGDDNSIPNKKYVNDQIGTAVPTVLNDLTDVTITAPVIDSYLQYNGAGQWVNIARIIRINDADDDSYVNVDLGGSDSDTVRIQAGSNPGANAGTISLETLAAVTAGFGGGDITAIAGDGIDAAGGDIVLTAGDGTYSASGADGGNINIYGGSGYGPAAATAFQGGDINIVGGPGVGVDTSGGTVTIVGGTGRGSSNSGGDVLIEGGNHDGTNLGAIVLSPGVPTGGGITESVYLRSKSSPLSTKAVELKFEEGTGGDYVGLVAPDSITTSRTWVLPTDDPAVAAGDFLTTDASGNLSFAAPTAATYRLAFTNGNLVGNILTVTHNLGQKYCQVAVYNDLDRIIFPDYIQAVDANTLTLDLSSFVPLSGTWNVVVTA